jgi:ABC-type phosphate/phosphonate transport system substrate-binding protein
LLLDGDIDAAVVDSSVLAVAIEHAPDIKSQLHTVLTLGPNPAPPIVATKSMGEKLLRDLRESLVSMNLTDAGPQILSATNFKAFSEVSEADYNSLKDLHTQMKTNSRYRESVLEIQITA